MTQDRKRMKVVEEEDEKVVFRRTNDTTVATFTPDALEAFEELENRQHGFVCPVEGFDAQQVIPGLWLGSLRAAHDISALSSNGIVHALTVVANIVDFHQVQRHAIANERERLGSWFKTHASVSINDESSVYLFDFLERSMEYIDDCLDQKNGGILVHCHMGMSCAPSVIIAYLMTRQKLTFKEALLKVQLIRPIVSPNGDFYDQLECLGSCDGDISKAKEKSKSSRGYFLTMI